jgi:ankyrin repeat protein
MATSKRVPRQGHQIDVERLSAQVDWSDPTEMERVVLSGGFPPDIGRLISEIEDDPDLAKLNWGDGETLLHVAAGLNALALATCLLSKGASVDAVSVSLGSPLHEATQYNHTEMAQLLLKHSASANLLNGLHRTPLHYAALKNNIAVARLLIEHGASVHVRDRSGLTPLDLAASNCFPEMTTLLVEQGATSRKAITNSYIQSLRESSRTGD